MKAKIKGLGEFGPDEDLSTREFVVPRTVWVFRAGPRPRERVKMLLNRRTAHNYDQLLTEITHAVHMSCAIKYIFTTSGRRVRPPPDTRVLFRELAAFRPLPSPWQLTSVYRGIAHRRTAKPLYKNPLAVSFHVSFSPTLTDNRHSAL